MGLHCLIFEKLHPQLLHAQSTTAVALSFHATSETGTLTIATKESQFFYALT